MITCRYISFYKCISKGETFLICYSNLTLHSPEYIPLDKTLYTSSSN